MANKQEVLLALELFQKNRPQKVFDEMKKKEMGVFSVIKYLNEAEGEVNSVDISKALGISSARMAVLLKKMEKKGLVVKSSSMLDARAVAVKLSDQGEALAENIKAQMFQTMEKIVDEFGLAELEAVMDKLGKIKQILEENMPAKMEGFDG